MNKGETITIKLDKGLTHDYAMTWITRDAVGEMTNMDKSEKGILKLSGDAEYIESVRRLVTINLLGIVLEESSKTPPILNGNDTSADGSPRPDAGIFTTGTGKS